MIGVVADMRKKLVKHGNSRALVIDKALLEVLGIGEDDDVVVSTDGESISVKRAGQSPEREARIDHALERIEQRYSNTLKRLAE